MENMDAEVNQPKYRQILEDLRDKIRKGIYKTGQQVPTEMDLAKEYGVARQTVQSAFRELVNEGLVERRAGSGTFVRSSLEGKGKRLVLVRPVGEGWRTDIFGLVSQELKRLAGQSGYFVLEDVLLGQDEVKGNGELLTLIREEQINGVWFGAREWNPTNTARDKKLAEDLRAAKVAVVLIDRDVTTWPDRSDFDLVSMDNFHAGFRLGNHLLEGNGKTSLAFVCRPHSAPTVPARAAGLFEAMRLKRISPCPDWIQEGELNSKFFNQLLSNPRFDTFVCANDETAMALLSQLLTSGRKVPNDYRVASFDDTEAASKAIPVPLTSFRQPVLAIADAAFKRLVERIEKPSLSPQSILLTGDLRQRASTVRMGKSLAPAPRRPSA